MRSTPDQVIALPPIVAVHVHSRTSDHASVSTAASSRSAQPRSPNTAWPNLGGVERLALH